MKKHKEEAVPEGVKKLKIVVLEDLNSMQGLGLLRQSRALDGVMQLRLKKFFKPIDEEAKNYYEVKEKVIEKYAEGRDDKGNFLADEKGGVRWKNKTSGTKALKEIADLVDAEFEIGKPFQMSGKKIPVGTLNSVEMQKLENLGIMKFND